MRLQISALNDTSTTVLCLLNDLLTIMGAVMAVIVWQLDLQIPAQSVPITTKVVISNPVHGEVYLIQHNVIKFVSDLQQVGGFSLGTPVFSTNKTDRHNNSNIVESGIKHHIPTKPTFIEGLCFIFNFCHRLFQQKKIN